jgi:hypothetical protein
MKEPERPRAIAYIDLQWWFRASKFCFDTQYPTFNPKKLAKEVCRTNNWELDNTKCYLDFPAPDVSAFWSELWRMRVEDLQAQGMSTWICPQRTRQMLCVADPPHRVTVRSDADIMLRQSLDIHSDVLRNRVDVVLLFSKENKYIELVESIKKTAREEDRWIKIVTVYPYQEGRGKAGYAGINHTDWACVDSHMYKACSERIRKPQRAEQDFAEDTALDVASTSVE